MWKTKQNYLTAILSVTLLVLLFSSCKKEEASNTTTAETPSAYGGLSDAEKTIAERLYGADAAAKTYTVVSVTQGGSSDNLTGWEDFTVILTPRNGTAAKKAGITYTATVPSTASGNHSNVWPASGYFEITGAEGTNLTVERYTGSSKDANFSKGLIGTSGSTNIAIAFTTTAPSAINPTARVAGTPAGAWVFTLQPKS